MQKLFSNVYYRSVFYLLFVISLFILEPQLSLIIASVVLLLSEICCYISYRVEKKLRDKTTFLEDIISVIPKGVHIFVVMDFKKKTTYHKDLGFRVKDNIAIAHCSSVREAENILKDVKDHFDEDGSKYKRGEYFISSSVEARVINYK